jgi:hypothetical protein
MDGQSSREIGSFNTTNWNVEVFGTHTSWLDHLYGIIFVVKNAPFNQKTSDML